MQKRYRHVGLRALRVGFLFPALVGAVLGAAGCGGEIFVADVACIRYPVRALDAFSIPTGVALGDFDDDGDQDVAIANSLTGVVFVYVNAGDGSFESPFLVEERGFPGFFPLPIEVFTGGSPVAIAAGDVSGDGIADLVVTDFLNASVMVVSDPLDAARGVSIDTLLVSAGPISVALGDLNGDDVLDIVTAGQTSNRVSVLLNNGSGGFDDPAIDIVCPGNPAAVAVADLDGVNGLDIVTANSGGADASVFLNGGGGSFPTRTGIPFGNDPSGVALGDLDGVNGPDMVVSVRGDDFVVVRYNDGLGGFGDPETISGVSEPSAVAIAEIDGVSGPEILVASAADDSLTVISSVVRGGGPPGAVFATGKAPVAIATGDVNNDGRIDVVVANSDSDNVSIMRNTPPLIVEEPDARGAGFPASGLLKTHATLDTGVDPVGIVSGDFDDDGIRDLVTVNVAENSVSFLKNIFNGRFAEPVASSAGPAPTLIASGVFDDAASLDLVVVSPLIQSMRLLLNNGDGTFSTSDTAATGADPTAVVVSVDFDGHNDVIVANGAPGEFYFYITAIDGTVVESSVESLFGLERIVGVSTIDFDLDGVFDVLAIAIDFHFDKAAEVRSDPPGGILLLSGGPAEVLRSIRSGDLTRGFFIPLDDRPSAIATLFAFDPLLGPPPAALEARGFGADGPTALLGVTSADSGTLSLVFVDFGAGELRGGDYAVFTTDSLCFGTDLVGSAVSLPPAPDTVEGGRGGDGEFLVFWGCPEIQSVFYIDLLASLARGDFGVAINIITVELGQSGLVTGDFDGDGRVDVAVTNQDPDNVSVVMNMGPSGGPWAILPDNVAVPEGETLVLEAKVGGTPGLFFGVQWFKDGMALFDGGDISGANSPTLIVMNASSDDEGAYSISVENSCGEEVFGEVIVTLAPPIGGCTGDANGDGVVNFDDILSVLANFGGTGPEGDANDDAIVDFNDILSVLANFGVTCAPAFCLGDADGNGIVNFDDTLSVLANFGSDYSPGTGPGDADGNGIVNFDDNLTVLANFGVICPGAPDGDGDGTPDVIDGCPNDAFKIDPGVCGCNVEDVDTDGDGFFDCEDACPDVAGDLPDGCPK